MFAGVAVRGDVVEKDQVQVTEQLRTVFGGRGARVITPVEKKATVERERRVMKDLDERLDDAARAAATAENDDDWGGVRATLQDALEVFEENLAYTEDDAAWARYRELMVMTATTQLHVNDPRAAERALRQLLAVEPEWEPPASMKPTTTEPLEPKKKKKGKAKKAPEDEAPALTPNEQVEQQLYQRFVVVRDELKATPSVSLEVKSRPASAKVLVDGRRAGRAPVAVFVPPGVHYVIVEDNGRVVRERVVVTDEGGRVSARLGSPELEAAQKLTAQLRKPETKKSELLDLAYDVADVCLVAVVVPYGGSVSVVVARVTDGALDAVVGAHLPRNEGSREQAVFHLVEAALNQKADGWVDASDPAATLRPLFLSGTGDRTIQDEPEPTNVPLLLGGIAGGVAVVGGIGVAIAVVVLNEQKKDAGFFYAVDTSGLK